MEANEHAAASVDDAARLHEVARLLGQAAQSFAAQADHEADAEQRYLLQDAALGAVLLAGQTGALLDRFPHGLDTDAEAASDPARHADAGRLLQRAEHLIAQVAVPLPELFDLRSAVADLAQASARL